MQNVTPLRGQQSEGFLRTIARSVVGEERLMRIRTLATGGAHLLAVTLLDPGPGLFAAGQWIPIGPKHVSAPALSGQTPPLGAYNAVGRLTTIAIHPTQPAIIYVGSPGELGQEGCGIWKTTNGGSSWTPIGDGLPTLAVAAIAIDPTAPDRVYIATADQGIFRSDDAGQHWDKLSGPLPVRTNTADGDRTALLINPASPNVLYLTTDGGVLRSADGGHSWPASLDVGQATNLVMDPQNPDVLYAGILGLGVYKTTDGGVQGNTSWQLQNQSPLPSAIPSVRGPLLAISHPAAEAHETVYALYPTNTTQNPGWQLFRTTDGTSWGSGSVYSCAPGSSNCLFFIVGADPANRNRVFLAGPLLFISEIGVTPFTLVPPVGNDRQPDSPHGDYWELAFDPTNPQNVYAGSDGGIFRSTNHGLTGSWSFIGDGITNAEIYDLAQAATQPAVLLAGTQDNGNILYTGGLDWDHIPHSQVQGGDGAAVAIDPTNANILYQMGQLQDSLSQSSDGGGSFVSFNGGLPAGPSPGVPGTVCAAYNSTFQLEVHPLLPTTLLASCGSLWRTTTNIAPGSWTSIFSPPPAAGRVVRSAIDAGGDWYYVGTNLGHVLAGPDDLSGWQDVLSHPAFQPVSDIEVDRAHPDTIYVSFAPPFQVNRPCAASTGQDRVYQLKRTAVPTPAYSFTDITGNLRSSLLCVNSVAVDPHAARTLYVGTNRGVYQGRGDAAGGPWLWKPYNNGLPLADVRDLEVHPTTGNIDAATYGRSAFELVPNLPPKALCQDVIRPADGQCQALVEPEKIDSGSFDPEGFALTLGVNPPGPYAKGQTVVTLTVTDDDGATDTCSATVTVVDDTAPVVTAPAPLTLECSAPGGVPLGAPAVQAWLATATALDNCDGALASIGNDAPPLLPSGCPPGQPSVVTVSATDSSGNLGSAKSTLTVQDSAPPLLSCAVGSSTLWPPNHDLRDVGFKAGAHDLCDGKPGVLDFHVTSDEQPATEPGSGGPGFCPDAIIGAGGSILLRAERSGSGNGRVYRIHGSAADSCGNVAVCAVPVNVPHDQGPGGGPVDSGQLFNASVCK